MLRWIDLATVVKFGTLSLLPGFTWVSRVPDLDPNVSELHVATDRRHSHFGLAVETRKANLVRQNGGIVVNQWLNAVDMEIKPLFKIIEQGEKIQNLPRAAESDNTGRPPVLCRLIRFWLRLRSLATIAENVYAVTTNEEPRPRVAEAVELLSRCGVEKRNRRPQQFCDRWLAWLATLVNTEKIRPRWSRLSKSSGYEMSAGRPVSQRAVFCSSGTFAGRLRNLDVSRWWFARKARSPWTVTSVDVEVAAVRKRLGAPPSWYRRAMFVGTKPLRGISHLSPRRVPSPTPFSILSCRQYLQWLDCVEWRSDAIPGWEIVGWGRNNLRGLIEMRCGSLDGVGELVGRGRKCFGEKLLRDSVPSVNQRWVRSGGAGGGLFALREGGRGKEREPASSKVPASSMVPR